MDIKNLAKKEIFSIDPYEPGRPIEEVQRQFNLKNVIKLASNENPLGPSPKALEGIKKALKDLNRYPDGGGFYLKKKLSTYLGVETNNIVLGNGSDELITLALRAFLNKGEKVIIAEPTFLIYKIASLLEGAKVEVVPMGSFRYDLKAMKTRIDRQTKIVFIANPDNPTGSYVTKKEFDEFLNGLPENVLVFYDAAYYEFGMEYPDYPDIMKYKRMPNLIITRTFSKAYGLSGIRIGYAIADREVSAILEKVREPFNVNSLAQVAAISAIDDEAFLKKTLRLVKNGKEFLYANFKKLKLFYVPSATNFVLLDVKRDSREVFQKLLRKGVIVRDMRSWKLNTFIRVTIGTENENKKFIKALKETLED